LVTAVARKEKWYLFRFLWPSAPLKEIVFYMSEEIEPDCDARVLPELITVREVGHAYSIVYSEYCEIVLLLERSSDMKISPVEAWSASLKPSDTPQTRMADTTSWKPLYYVGGVAAIISILSVIIAIPIYILWPPPGGLLPTSSTVINCFSLLQRNWLLGLLSLDFLMLVGVVLGVLICLALYAALKRTSPSVMLIALILGLVGVAAYFAANPAFSMLALSNQYAAATNDAQRSLFVASGIALIANYQGTGFNTYYILASISTLLFAVFMLRSASFSKLTAYMGIATGALTLIPATAGTIGLYLSFLSLIPMIIWYILIARRFFQLGQDIAQEERQQPA
jgi:Domain of unknown function (DUF4386)